MQKGGTKARIQCKVTNINYQHRPTSGYPHMYTDTYVPLPPHSLTHAQAQLYLPSRGEDLSMSLHPVRQLSCPKVLNLPYQTTSLHQTHCYRPNSCSHGRLLTAGEEKIHRKVMKSLNGLHVLQAHTSTNTNETNLR